MDLAQKKWKGLFAGALLPNNESLDAKRIVTGKVALTKNIK